MIGHRTGTKSKPLAGEHPRLFLRVMVAIIGGATLLLLAGCNDSTDVLEDTTYLREATPTPPPALERGTRLFPGKTGSQWRYRVEGDGTPYTEVTTLVQKRGPNGVLQDVLQTERDKTRIRAEIFTVGDKELGFAGVGIDTQMVITPPVPQLRYPVTEGAYYPWTGTLQIENSTVDATGLSRIGAYESVEALNKYRYNTYRVDTLIIATVEGQRVEFPTIRWFAPNVGIIKQKFLMGRKQLVKILLDYHLAE